MTIADMNWVQVVAYLQTDDRCLLPIGCTEQHAWLSLAVDTLLAERFAVEAAEPLGAPPPVGADRDNRGSLSASTSP